MLRVFPSSFSSANVCQVSSTGTSSGGQWSCRQSSTSVRRRSSDSSQPWRIAFGSPTLPLPSSWPSKRPHLVRTVGRSSSGSSASASPITVSAWPRP